MEKIKINVQERKETGKEKVKKLRNQGQLIANLYIKGEESISLLMNYNDLHKHLFMGKGKNNIFTFEIGKKSYDAIPYEIQLHPISKQLVHVDFKCVKENEKVKVKVPVHLKGVALGIKKGGSLDQKIHSVAIKVLPNEIPLHIEVDVTKLDVGAELTVKDLPLPKSAVIVGTPAHMKVLVIWAAAKQVAPAPVAAAAAPEAAAAGAPATTGAAPGKAAPAKAPAKA